MITGQQNGLERIAAYTETAPPDEVFVIDSLEQFICNGALYLERTIKYIAQRPYLLLAVFVTRDIVFNDSVTFAYDRLEIAVETYRKRHPYWHFQERRLSKENPVHAEYVVPDSICGSFRRPPLD